MLPPHCNISHLPAELLLQILDIQHGEHSPNWELYHKFESRRLGTLRLVCKRFADAGLTVLLDRTAHDRPFHEIVYSMTERSLVRIEAISRNPTLASLVTQLDCRGYVYDPDLMARQLDCSDQCRHRDSMDPGQHMGTYLFAKSRRIRLFYMAQYHLVLQGTAGERLQKALPRFPNLQKLVRTGLCSPGTRINIMTDYPVPEFLPVSSIHGWSNMVDVARALVPTSSHINTLELLHAVPDLSTCSYEERAIIRSFTKAMPTLHTLSIRPWKLDPLDKIQLFTRVHDTAAEAQLWRNTFFVQMTSLRSLEVCSRDHPDDTELGDSSITRILLEMHFPQLEALRITGLGVYHDAFMAFLLLHSKTLAEIELQDYHTIVSAGRLSETYDGHDYSECVYGDWVECATLLLAMRRRGCLKKLRLGI
jgi:hypothetical protein